MLQNIKKRNSDQKGFTIIEVLIVLAIAGLILLIVFLAVPSLQRNSRNTGRKNDVANILGALSEYTNNNGGALPATCAAGACNAANSWLSNAKVGTLDAALVSLSNVGTARTGAPVTPAAGLDGVQLYNYAKCANATTATYTNATKRSIIALYNVETGGNVMAQCQESGS